MRNNLFFKDETEDYQSYEETYQNLFVFLAGQLLEKTEELFLSVTLVGEETSLAINTNYRSKEKVADVITFAYLDDKEEVLSADFLDLGEIVICPKAVLDRAVAIGNNFASEMEFIFIHGFLHLLGYDHELGKEEEELMYRKQEELFDLWRNEHD